MVYSVADSTIRRGNYIFEGRIHILSRPIHTVIIDTGDNRYFALPSICSLPLSKISCLGDVNKLELKDTVCSPIGTGYAPNEAELDLLKNILKWRSRNVHGYDDLSKRLEAYFGGEYQEAQEADWKVSLLRYLGLFVSQIN